MSKLTIIADVQVKPAHIAAVKSELLKLIPITLQEEGCITYDLHQDNDNKAHFIFYETWENRQLWQNHMNNTHLQDYIAATEGLIEKLSIYEMTVID